ncbi:hypothetical protein [Paenibacillus elgii]|nr:hypothetical protein [Paenibacillus elgii]
MSVLDAALSSGNKKVLDIGTAYGTLLLYSVLWGMSSVNKVVD